ncbi:MAG TPA: 2,3-bisphosphoglycerate-independent phosphoglycerate mutase [Dehalococcoidales bacterium]|nr:2,3-bisphosphoglycerate-independent phosphoglycerate mutase [Dehalococcoidales bacterium]
MNMQDLMKELSIQTPSKIIMMVIDGLGGLPDPRTGDTELETARMPNLDALAAGGVCGLSYPVAPGITPGSGPGHLALFGYDPIECNIGRGVLEAVGIDVELGPGDIAARGNFCTIDAKGIITDRRAGRISTDKCAELCKLLDNMDIDGVRIKVYPVREHRFVVVFGGGGLEPDVSESDPSRVGVAPLEITALNPGSHIMAEVAMKFVAKARDVLTSQHPANMLLLRGFAKKPHFPTMQDLYKLNPLAIAVYPMYRGLARLVGMKVAATGTTLEDEFKTLQQNYKDYDFFFIHVKWTDTAGEDGDFSRKVKVLEQIDAAIPTLTALKPDVLVVTGDHSTPAMLKGHSWHPVPVLISAKYCRGDAVPNFSEIAFINGGLGRINATQIMPLAMANALKLTKFGA